MIKDKGITDSAVQNLENDIDYILNSKSNVGDVKNQIMYKTLMFIIQYNKLNTTVLRDYARKYYDDEKEELIKQIP